MNPVAHDSRLTSEQVAFVEKLARIKRREQVRLGNLAVIEITSSDRQPMPRPT